MTTDDSNHDAYSDDSEREYTYRPDERKPKLTKKISEATTRKIDETARNIDPTPK